MNYTIGETTYSYEVSGKGPPIVMLHGFTGSKATWSRIKVDCEDAVQVITIDLPEHGETTTKRPLSMEACCQDLDHFFTHLNLSKVHLIGYSMGGRLALTFSMLYPDRVSSLILESASPGLRLEKERLDRIQDDEKLAKKLEQEGLQAFVQFWEDLPLFHTQNKLPQTTQAMIRKERLAQSPSKLAQSLRSMGTGKQPSWWSRLAYLQVPVLLIVGELDKKFVMISKEMKSCLPKAELVVVDHVGHAVHIEQPFFFSTLVLDYILKLEKDNIEN